MASRKSSQEIKQQHEKKYGTRIERTLLDITESWSELESDPGLFSLLAHDLAGEQVDVVEIVDLNKDLQEQIGGDEEVYGLILLFQFREDRNQRRYNKELEEKFVINENTVNSMFFALQKTPNSCATHALLSIILNSPTLPLDGVPLLKNFKEYTHMMPPEVKGYAVGNCPEFAAFHNRRAPMIPAIASSVTNTKTVSKSSAHTVMRVRQYHFVPYVRVDGQLMELDGLKEHPISHGPVTNEDFLETCRNIILHRSTVDTNKLNYVLLAVKACARTRFIREMTEVQDAFQRTLAQIGLADIRQRSASHALHSNTLPECANVLQKRDMLLPEIANILQKIENRRNLSSDPRKVPTNLCPQTEDLSEDFQNIVNKLSELRTLISSKITEAEQKKPITVFLPPTDGEVELVEQCSTADSAESLVKTESPFDELEQEKLTCNETADTNLQGTRVFAKTARIAASVPSTFLPISPNIDVLEEGMKLIATFHHQEHIMETRKKRVSAKNLGSGKFRTATFSAGFDVPESNLIKAPLWVPSTNHIGVVNGHADHVTSSDSVGLPGRSRSSSTSTIVSEPQSYVSIMRPVETLKAIVASHTVGNKRKGAASSSVVPLKLARTRSSSRLTAPCISARAETQQEQPILIKLEDSRNHLPVFGEHAGLCNPESLALSVLDTLVEQRSVITELLTFFRELISLEKQRVALYQRIVQENLTRESTEKDAAEREFDHDQYITLLLKRMFELNLLTPQELDETVPPSWVKKAESGESDESLPEVRPQKTVRSAEQKSKSHKKKRR